MRAILTVLKPDELFGLSRAVLVLVILLTSSLGMAQMTPPPEDGQWTMPGKDYSARRYSGLDQITTSNVAQLRPVFTFSTGVLRGHEAAPIVAGSTMYLVTPYPNFVYALDLSKAGAPLKWKFEPKPAAAAQGQACCDVVNRGGVFDDGRFFFNTLDGQTIALDANTGQQLWRTQLADINRGETITMAPLVVKGKVLVGNSGGEYGTRGWLTALDARNGSIAWRAFSTGTDKDVLIGPDYKPFYAKERGTDLGVSSWQPEGWKTGGGNVWGWLSYDPAMNLVYYGTANPAPWNPHQRPGDNKWTSGIFARNPDNGEARWFYQLSPHDLHDYDGVNESILVDMQVGGAMRTVLLHPDRNGYVYVMDRSNGEVLSATPYVPVNTSTGVDLKTGDLKYVPSKEPQVGKVVRDACPASPGGKDWQPSAYSPRTHLLYIPHQNICQDVQAEQASYIPATPFIGMTVRMNAGPGGHRGEFSAWDPTTNTKTWHIDEDFPVWSGALATAGDVVFYGTMDGWFKAVHARTGAVLWQYATGSGIVGQPIAYRGPDGKEYIAVLSGVGGWAGAVVAGDLDVRDATAATGFANLLGDLKQKTTKGGTLHVFALP